MFVVWFGDEHHQSSNRGLKGQQVNFLPWHCVSMVSLATLAQTGLWHECAADISDNMNELLLFQNHIERAAFSILGIIVWHFLGQEIVFFFFFWGCLCVYSCNHYLHEDSHLADFHHSQPPLVLQATYIPGSQTGWLRCGKRSESNSSRRSRGSWA